MIIETQLSTTILKNTTSTLNSFLETLNLELANYTTQNIIVDVSTINVNLKDIKLFAETSKNHKKNKKSFIIVAINLDYNSIPTKLSVVPTIQEAKDLIEMEEIERDLGF